MEQEQGKLLTIKEYADKAGVTIQAVYKRINNPNTELAKFVVEQNGKKLLKAEALEVIPPRQTPEKSENEILHEMVKMLQAELGEKNEQIRSLNKQLEQMTDSVNKTAQALAETQISLQAAQALHAGTIQQNSEIINDLHESQEAKVHEPEPEQRKGFFANFFRR